MSSKLPLTKKEDMDPAIAEHLKNYQSVYTRRRKLNKDQQLEMCELMARFCTNDEIRQHFAENHKVFISPALVGQYKRTEKWKPVIQKLRATYLGSMTDVPGTHKKIRMERREKIYEVAMKTGQLKHAITAVKHQEEEMEGRNQGNVNLTFNQFNGLTDEELEEKKRDLLERIKAHQAITIQPKGEISEQTNR